VQILAKADAQRVTLQAEAAASHNKVALDRMLIEQLPQIVKEAANGLAGANLNVLNGADGLSEIAAGLVSQGLTILDAVKKGLSSESAARPAITSEQPNGQVGGAS
jgi:flotillin